MQRTVARTRALLTENDRAVLTGEKGDQNRHRNVKWEIENRITDELPQDIALLAEHHPDLLAELREVVCEADDRAALRADLERALEYREWGAVEDALARLEDADD